MKVAVIGGGPSGMFTAWAAIQYGCDVTVFDQNPEAISVGKNHGVFALWNNCGLFLSQKAYVKIGIIGAKGLVDEDIEESYAWKVYGKSSMDQSVSITKYCSYDIKECFNHAEAYQQIVDILGRDRIKPIKINSFSQLRLWSNEFDKTFVTIPAYLLWPDKMWPSRNAYVYSNDAPKDDAFMIYNINHYIPWYRCSAIFGQFAMEYASGSFMPIEKKLVTVKKVLDPVVTPEQLCTDDDIHFIGRYGAWRKDMLTEDCYTEAAEILNGQIRRAF